ncbi:uncharacterized protein SOCE26_031260 [Sorangium cellulosum]|uniref:Uncharacterized protein n=1 Tax=Sorangium cellulosum TaxID=56 RepID=A0A2L0EQZ5_SORCE|nr:hypothetical protein [Sorangium cellulosum]AUX41704.1 uncharacterized protein SOCE26_031260 [Sorangium cellulosum]
MGEVAHLSTDGTDGNSAAVIGGTVDSASLSGERPPTREEAEAILDRVVALYQDHAAAANPAGTHEISWRIDWDSDAVSAHVLLKPGEDWTIEVSKGYLTASSMTTEVFALTMCHEMGHFIGGFPFKTSRGGHNTGALGTSVSSEGQSDYFATKDCLPRLWANETEANAAAFAALDPSARERCTTAYSDLASQQLCGRILLASLQTGRFYEEQAVLQAPRELVYPRFDTPDTTEVAVTKEGHPAPQCRLDTLVAGAVCSVKATGTGIPGFVPPYGEYSDASEEDARPFACQTGPGARPRCWFQPDTVVTDCSELGQQACVVEDGVHGVRYCDTTSGVSYYWCFAHEVCKASGDDFADCYAPDVDPEE